MQAALQKCTQAIRPLLQKAEESVTCGHVGQGFFGHHVRGRCHALSLVDAALSVAGNRRNSNVTIVSQTGRTGKSVFKKLAAVLANPCVFRSHQFYFVHAKESVRRHQWLRVVNW